MRSRRTTTRSLATVVAVIAALSGTGCAGTDDPEPSSQPSASASISETRAPTTSAAPAPPTAPAGTNIAVTYAGGQPGGDTGRVTAPLGDQVTIAVTSDVADEIHLHGYDLSTEVTPGAPATLTFEATIPGVFEVELEQIGTLLFTLQVG